MNALSLCRPKQRDQRPAIISILSSFIYNIFYLLRLVCLECWRCCCWLCCAFLFYVKNTDERFSDFQISSLDFKSRRKEVKFMNVAGECWGIANCSQFCSSHNNLTIFEFCCNKRRVEISMETPSFLHVVVQWVSEELRFKFDPSEQQREWIQEGKFISRDLQFIRESHCSVFSSLYTFVWLKNPKNLFLHLNLMSEWGQNTQQSKRLELTRRKENFFITSVVGFVWMEFTNSQFIRFLWSLPSSFAFLHHYCSVQLHSKIMRRNKINKQTPTNG